MNNIQIGSSNTNPSSSQFIAKIHEKIIYDSTNWKESGTICFDAKTGNFYVEPFEKNETLNLGNTLNKRSESKKIIWKSNKK